MQIKSTQTLITVWVAWAILILGFQSLAAARVVDVIKPDNVLDWTAQATGADRYDERPLLALPFMNNQISWDSEFYLAIATDGYDSPNVRTVKLEDGRELALTHGFMPMYPVLMRLIGTPLILLGMNITAAVTLAGWLISLAAALVGVLSLFALVRSGDTSDSGINGADREAWANRSAYYLLIFPSALFLAQVYTESLFIAFSFSSLLLMHRGRMWWAAVLAGFAIWTRATGIVLLLPMTYYIIRSVEWRKQSFQISNLTLMYGPLLLTLASYLAWSVTLGVNYTAVQNAFFGRSIEFALPAIAKWFLAVFDFPGMSPQTQAYYVLEFTAIGLTLLASLFMLRRYPAVVLYSLGVVGLAAATSQVPQSMIRYVLVAPVLFLWLGYQGRYFVFDRIWSLASVLVLALLTLLFTFDMWVA